MKCDRAQEIFSDYLEGTLERPMAFMLEHHLKECQACGHDYERFQATWNMLEAVPEVEVPAGFKESVMARIRAEHAPIRRRAWSLDLAGILGARIQVRAVAVAAAAVLFAAMAVKVPNWPVVGAHLWGHDLPQTATLPDTVAQIDDSTVKAVVDPGLNITVTGYPGTNGMTLYSIDMKPNSKATIKAHGFLMSQGATRFNEQNLRGAYPLFRRSLDGGQTSSISMPVQKNDGPSVIYISWTYNSTPMAKAVFLPANLSPDTTATASFSSMNEPMLQTLQRISTTYGVVIIADAGIQNTVEQVQVANGSAEQTLYKVLKDEGFRSKKLADNVFTVEPKL